MTDVAVVIPNHDGRDLVGRCVIAAQEAGAAEVVVVDDASSDDSPAEAEAAGATLLRSPGRGFSAAVNAGADATTSPYLLLLNSDCFLEQTALSRLADALDADSALALCAARLVNADGSQAKSCGQLVSLANALRAAATGRSGGGSPAAAGHGVERASFVPLACALVRRSDWARVGGLDERYRFYFEDYDLCWRLGEAGRSVGVCWDAQAIHVGGASSSGRDPQRWFVQYNESRGRYLRKRYPRAWVVYALGWPPLALLHAARRFLRGGEENRRWARAFVASARATGRR